MICTTCAPALGHFRVDRAASAVARRSNVDAVWRCISIYSTYTLVYRDSSDENPTSYQS